jgi:hypothetical protein
MDGIEPIVLQADDISKIIRFLISWILIIPSMTIPQVPLGSAADYMNRLGISRKIGPVRHGRIMMPPSVIREFFVAPDPGELLLRPDAAAFAARLNISKFLLLLCFRHRFQFRLSQSRLMQIFCGFRYR